MLLGEKIRTTRTRKGVTGEGLAELLGVTRSAISSWENSRETPSLRRCFQICEVLDVDPSSFFRGVTLDDA